MRAQSVSSAVRARAWQAAIAACSAYGPSAPPSCLGALERRQAAADQQLVPARAVLVEQQDRLARRADARARARRLDLHQRDQAVDLGLLAAPARPGCGRAAARPRTARAASSRRRRSPSSPR